MPTEKADGTAPRVVNHKSRPITPEQAAEAMREVQAIADRLGHCPSVTTYERETGHSYRRCLAFSDRENWSDVAKAVGYDFNHTPTRGYVKFGPDRQPSQYHTTDDLLKAFARGVLEIIPTYERLVALGMTSHAAQEAVNAILAKEDLPPMDQLGTTHRGNGWEQSPEYQATPNWGDE